MVNFLDLSNASEEERRLINEILSDTSVVNISDCIRYSAQPTTTASTTTTTPTLVSNNTGSKPQILPSSLLTTVLPSATATAVVVGSIEKASLNNSTSVNEKPVLPHANLQQKPQQQQSLRQHHHQQQTDSQPAADTNSSTSSISNSAGSNPPLSFVSQTGASNDRITKTTSGYPVAQAQPYKSQFDGSNSASSGVAGVTTIDRISSKKIGATNTEHHNSTYANIVQANNYNTTHHAAQLSQQAQPQHEQQQTPGHHTNLFRPNYNRDHHMQINQNSNAHGINAHSHNNQTITNTSNHRVNYPRKSFNNNGNLRNNRISNFNPVNANGQQYSSSPNSYQHANNSNQDSSANTSTEHSSQSQGRSTEQSNNNVRASVNDSNIIITNSAIPPPNVNMDQRINTLPLSVYNHHPTYIHHSIPQVPTAKTDPKSRNLNKQPYNQVTSNNIQAAPTPPTSQVSPVTGDMSTIVGLDMAPQQGYAMPPHVAFPPPHVYGGPPIFQSAYGMGYLIPYHPQTYVPFVMPPNSVAPPRPNTQQQLSNHPSSNHPNSMHPRSNYNKNNATQQQTRSNPPGQSPAYIAPEAAETATD